jgi:tellurite resistance protein TerC
MNPHQIVLLAFAIVVTVLFTLDIRSLFKYKENVVSNKNAIVWTLIWLITAMAFSVFVYYEEGLEKFYQFQSAYWIEQSLSVDNLFVFLMVFKYFKTSGKVQHKVLLWGIIGAICLRAIFIFTGTWLINLTYLPPYWKFVIPVGESPNSTFFNQINLLILFFGAMLLYGGIKSLISSDLVENTDFNKTFGARFVRKNFKVLTNDKSGSLWIVRNGKFFFTNLFVVLVVIETTDLLFAIDSIPAIFSIAPDDPLILYTSNVFAIFGLRSMYFLLAKSMDKFSKLQYGISFILAFIGIKMIISPIHHIDTMISLCVILFTLLISVVWSLRSAK